MPLDDVGRTLVVVGLLLALVGVLVWLLGGVPFLGHLPGDISVERGNFRFYAPLATCLLMSLVLTVALNLLARHH
jgi:hypothetical protein